MLRKVFIVLCLVLPAVFVVPAVAQAQLPDFTELVEKQGPAVVNISTVSTKRRGPSPLMKHFSNASKMKVPPLRT